MSSLKEQHGGNHYKQLQIQPVEYCQANRLLFCESSVVKYITRHRDKSGVEDVKKAIHFAQMLLEMEYGVKSTVVYDAEKPNTKPKK